MTASVEVALIRPAATFWICRSLPNDPTEKDPIGAVPAKPETVVPLIVALDTATGEVAIDPSPNAILRAADTLAPEPSAMPVVALGATTASLPIAIEPVVAALVR